MTKKTEVELEEGRVYRTEELRAYSANLTRLARQLEQEGRLHEVAHGLYAFLIKQIGADLAGAAERDQLSQDGQLFMG